MIEHYAPSLSLTRGLRVRDYESIDELDTAAGERGAALKWANKYLVEKGSLVDGRDKFTEELAVVTSFPWRMKKVVKKKADGSVEAVEEPDETEVGYVSRFRKAITDGSFTHERFPKDGLEDAMQAFADSLGAFNADAKKPERVAKLKTPPKWVMERVEIIFANGTAAKWWETMSAENIPIAAACGDKDKDKLALAWAIREREVRREKEESKKYA